MFRHKQTVEARYLELFADEWHRLPLETQRRIRRESPAFGYLCTFFGMRPGARH